jgi:mono/diheme cytochrome c family protein
MRRLLIGLLAIVLLAICAFAVYVQLTWDRTFAAPPSALRASTDSAMIARGRYLIYGPAHCAYCHTENEALWARIDAGETVPLTGGFVFPIPPGRFYTPNLTPDSETGIGRRTDEQLVQMIRHGVRADGRAAVPFMEYFGLSDEDLVALLSYLRSQPPVRNEVPEHEINFMGKAVMALVIRPPGERPAPPAKSPPEGPTLERGAYLANNVALCAGCHSPRNMMTGALEGAPFSGGNPSPSDVDPEVMLAPPNLTPHDGTGFITSWSEDQFLARFRAGKLIPETIMPWAAYARMTDDDIRAIYRYLGTLEPVERNPGPPVTRPQG